MSNYSGLYIVLEGIIGAGKSEQLSLMQDALRDTFPNQSIIFTREPGGTPKAERLRKKLKFEKLSPEEEVELFAKARESTLAEVVRPALQKGEIVVSDRSFISSLAYQGLGRGLGIHNVWKANESVVNGTVPDVVIFLDVGVDAAVGRSRSVDPDKFDGEIHDFWNNVRDGYYEAIKWLQTEFKHCRSIIIADPLGQKAIKETHLELLEHLKPVIKDWEIYKETSINKERE